MLILFFVSFKCILFSTSFPHGTFVQNSRKLKAWKERIATTSNSSIVGVLRCHLDCSLAFCLVCSRSGSSTARLCLYFLQLSAFVKGFFMVMILLLGSGDTPMKWWIWKRKEKQSPYPTDHVISVQTCHCQTHSPWLLNLIHNFKYSVLRAITNK